MSNNESITRLLVAVERRIRLNRIANDIARGLTAALFLPVGFKLLDLVSPFRGATVTAFFAIWAVATSIWLIGRVRGSGTLERTAAHIDHKTGAKDEFKTAYWFIRNPKPSPWVEAQIERAARNANRIEVAALYPRIVPRSAYVAASFILVLGILNFLPLPWNNNWFRLQGAPGFSLTREQKALLAEASRLLREAEALEKTDTVEKLEEIVRALQAGSVSTDGISRSLSELEAALSERSLDAGRLADNLEAVAQGFAPSSLTKLVATDLARLDLESAAADIREISRELNQAGEVQTREMAERFQQSSDLAKKGLDKLAGDLRDASNAMRLRDTSGATKALEEIAKEFERLQRALSSQQLRNEAGGYISALRDSINGNPGEPGERRETTVQSGGNGEGQGQGKETASGAGRGAGEGQGQGEGDGKGEGQGRGQGDGNGDGSGAGRGGDKAGLSGPPPGRGEPTSLETQLDREVLPVRPTRGSRPEAVEEASQRERSKLDYRNTPLQLRPAQKDLLNQGSIPWQQRRFVKEYFETIRK